MTSAIFNFCKSTSSDAVLQSMVFDQFLSPEDLAPRVRKEIVNYFSTANSMHDQLKRSV